MRHSKHKLTPWVSCIALLCACSSDSEPETAIKDQVILAKQTAPEVISEAPQPTASRSSEQPAQPQREQERSERKSERQQARSRERLQRPRFSGVALDDSQLDALQAADQRLKRQYEDLEGRATALNHAEVQALQSANLDAYREVLEQRLALHREQQQLEMAHQLSVMDQLSQEQIETLAANPRLIRRLMNISESPISGKHPKARDSDEG